MTRKRWPAIEPHWRVLYASGILSCAMTWGEAASLGCKLRRLPAKFCPAVAIIKVTPK